MRSGGRASWASGVGGPSEKWRRRWTAAKRRAGHVWEKKKGVGRRERRPGERGKKERGREWACVGKGPAQGEERRQVGLPRLNCLLQFPFLFLF
jgi:hypothetical protein